jgi:transposase-like protein
MSEEIEMDEREDVKVETTPGEAEGGRRPTGAAAGAAPVKRWTAARKQEVVLRLLRGETLEAVSRDVGQPQYRIAEWRDRVVMGIPGLLHEGQGDGRDEALKEARRKIGELLMEIELLKKSPKKPSKRHRWKP